MKYKHSRALAISQIVLLVAAVILPLSNYFQLPTTQAADDLVAYWRLDEGSGASAIDSSGGGHTGVITNTSYSTTVPEVAFANTHSLYFNPANNGRIVTTPLQLNNYTQFTMAGWAYPTAANARASWFGQNDLFEFGFADGSSLFCYTSKGQASWSFNPGTFLNNWHHITCLATDSQLIIYVDGVNVATAGIGPGSFGSSSDYFSIGAGAVDGGTSGPFSGYIDDVRVYSRGLTPEEMGGLGSGDAGPGAASLPAISLTSPATDSHINSWGPTIDWADSDDCQYSWDGSDWDAADCAEAGQDIEQPSDAVDLTLFIRAKYTEESQYAEADTTFTLDTVAPTVEAGDNRQTNASFSQTTASASDATSGIDSYAWSKLSGPGSVTFNNAQLLQPTISSISLDGTYALRLTVTDNAGNQAYDDMTLIWDTTNPSVILNSFPNLYTKQTAANFTFSGSDDLSEPLTFTCKLDAASFNTCTSPASYTGLSEAGHSLTVRATDQAGNSLETATYNWTVDTTPPVITLTGQAAVTVVQGQTYADAGATALDTVSGNLTSSIVTSNPVDRHAPGAYTIRYNVTDQAGNSAIESTRLVTVVSNADLDSDGQADAIQDNITAIEQTFTGNPVAIKTSNDCTVSNANLKEITEIGRDDSYSYPLGLLDFSIECVDPGDTITITQYYYNPPTQLFLLRKFQHNSFITITDATMTKQIINGQDVLVVQYQITDGGPLDDDGLVNGTIIDPAGPAVLAQTTTQQIPNTGANLATATNLGLCLIILACLLNITAYIGKRRQSTR